MIGERLATARRLRGRTQSQLADAMGERYSQQMISHVENGRSSLLAEGLAKAAEILEVTVDYLVGLSDGPKPGLHPTTGSESTFVVIESPDESSSWGNEVSQLEMPELLFSLPWLESQDIDPEKAGLYRVTEEVLSPVIPYGATVIVDFRIKNLFRGAIYLAKIRSTLRLVKAMRRKAGWDLYNKPLGRMETYESDGPDDIVGLVRWVGHPVS